MLKIKNFDRFKLCKLVNLQDIITYLNLIFGLASIFFAIEKEFAMSSIMLLIAVVMDYFDGKVASLLDKKTDFGKQIDSLCDLVSFGIAPGILGVFYSKINMLEPSYFLLISIAFFLICGVSRLARYNIISHPQSFVGMPITLNGIIFPIFYSLSLNASLLPLIYLTSGILMVSTIKVKRLP